MGGLAGKARRLELARGISRSRGAATASLVWTSAEVGISLTSLRAGDLLVSDYTITERRHPDPSTAVRRDRVTVDPEDYGRVYAWDGREIGRVLRGQRGGIVLECSWPEDLASSAPAAAGEAL
jgi:hypothetical protein